MDLKENGREGKTGFFPSQWRAVNREGTFGFRKIRAIFDYLNESWLLKTYCN